jgi:peptide deformylase
MSAPSTTSPRPEPDPRLPRGDDVVPAPVLLLGDPRLRRTAATVTDFDTPALRGDVACLLATLAHVRRVHGFGRALAAPQIGVSRRLIAVDFGPGPFLVVNPEIVWSSPETFTLWDDCLSAPDLLVRLRRARALTLRYQDVRGVAQVWEQLDPAASELMQHELDHLDGVLFTDHALDRDALVMRSVFEQDHARFRAQVDYVIGD